MTLQAPPGSPWWLTLAADALLFAHIAGGVVGLLSGAAALVARKGSRAHSVAGMTFVVSMTVMASVGAVVSPFLPVPQRANAVAGLFTLYLVVSGWMAVRRPHVVPGRVDAAGLVVVLSTVAAGVVWAVQASNSPTGTLDGSPPQGFYAFAVLGGFAAVGDLRLFASGRVSGAPRLRRHLWRMCAALFIASGSFFLGQQRVMPVWMRGSPWLFVPALAPLVVMAYWLIRTRLKNGMLTSRRRRADLLTPGPSRTAVRPTSPSAT